MSRYRPPHRDKETWIPFFVVFLFLIGVIIYYLSFELVKRDYFFRSNPKQNTVSQKGAFESKYPLEQNRSIDTSLSFAVFFL